MGLYIIIFEVLIIVLYGIFARTGSGTVAISDLEAPLYFTLGKIVETQPSPWSVCATACTTGRCSPTTSSS
ncbi:unnamed protein product [Sphagnum balticum]